MCGFLNHVFQPTKVVVLDLSAGITEDAIAAYFNNFGDVLQVMLKTRRSANFAFVQFGSDEAAERALGMAPHMINVCPVRIFRAFRYGSARGFCDTRAVTTPVQAQWDPSPPAPEDPLFPAFEAVRAIWVQ